MAKIRSWVGFEEYRNQLIELSNRIRAYELSIDEYCSNKNISPLNLTLQGLKGITTNNLALENGKDMLSLQALCAKLTSMNFDTDFVRQEWLSILDPQ